MRQPYPVILVLLAHVFLSHTGFTQVTRFTGQVIDAAGRTPLAGASVYLLNSGDGTETDDDGYFRLNAKAALTVLLNDTLVVSFLGYHDYRTPLKDFKDGSLIQLQPVSLSIQDSILVSARRIDLVQQEIPHAREEIGFQTIEIRGLNEMSDVFKSIPSVRVEGNDLSGRSIQIRGSDASEVNVYIDGILLNNMGIDNTADLSVVPVEDVESIEVLKGPNLALLGSGAFGGVVNVTTRKNLRRSFMVKTKQGSFDTQYYIAEINYPLSGNFVVNYFGQLNALKPEIEYFPRERFSDKTQNNQIQTDKQNHHLSLSYYMKNGELNARFLGYLLDYQKPFWKDNRKNFLLAGSYRGSLWNVNNLDVSLSYLFNDDEIDRDTGEVNRFISGFQSGQLNLKVLKKITFKENELQLLGEYLHDELETDSDILKFGERNPLYHAFLYENRWSVAGVVAFSDHLKNAPYISWKTHLGLRGDLIATGDNYVYPTFGVQFEIKQPTWTLTPYANYGKNIRILTLSENAYISLMEIGREDTSLVRLDPEESNAAEIGSSFSYDPSSVYFQSIDAAFAVFRNNIFNKILRRPLEPFAVQSETGNNLILGLEASLKFNRLLKLFDLTSSVILLNISRPYLYTYKPESNYSVQVDYFSRWGLYFSTTYFYEGKSLVWYLDTYNHLIRTTIPPFNDLDVALGYRLRFGRSQLKVQFSGYNIFDNSEYRDYLLKKRFFQFSLSFRYSS